MSIKSTTRFAVQINRDRAKETSVDQANCTVSFQLWDHFSSLLTEESRERLKRASIVYACIKGCNTTHFCLFACFCGLKEKQEKTRISRRVAAIILMEEHDLVSKN